MKTIILTGACGFIGSHFVEFFLKETDFNIVVLDKLSYASQGFDRLRDIDCFDETRVKIFAVDLQEPLSFGVKQEIGEVDYIINLASESHVDNSISNPTEFIMNNVKLVLNMLEWAKELKSLQKFVQFSTDEVYGPAPDEILYEEGDRFNPSNPYSASKAAQECICMSYANTYKLPIVITNTMNVIGERQHSEKFVPLCIKKILTGETIQIHANKDKTKAGTRFYIHARNVAKAVYFILTETSETLNTHNVNSGKFHIVGEKELDNLELAKMIANYVLNEVVKQPELEKVFANQNFKYELTDFHSSRPGHDLRYGMSGSKLRAQGFEFPKTLEDSLKKTVEWYLIIRNRKWLER